MVKKFRTPKEIKPDEKAVPVSARIKESLMDDLKKMAKNNGYPLSKLIEVVLEDYVVWVKGQKKS